MPSDLRARLKPHQAEMAVVFEAAHYLDGRMPFDQGGTPYHSHLSLVTSFNRIT